VKTVDKALEQARKEKEEADKRREESEKTASRDKLDKIVQAMRLYHDANKKFPPATNTNLSWRRRPAALPGTGPAVPGVPPGGAWDSPHNRLLLSRMPDVYRAARKTRTNKTYYQVFTGTAGPFGEGKTPRLATSPPA